jgi:hypothetical protein
MGIEGKSYLTYSRDSFYTETNDQNLVDNPYTGQIILKEVFKLALGFISRLLQLNDLSLYLNIPIFSR